MRNRVIGVALAVSLFGIFPASAESPRREPAATVKAAEKPASVRQLIDRLLRRAVAPAAAAPVRKSPVGVFEEDDPFLPVCGESDPGVPCRVHMPVPG